MSSKKIIGLLGGTFDPIHFGHLRCALELYQAFEMKEMRLIPSHIPPHRQTPKASADHRLQMMLLATQQTPFSVDESEFHRAGPSYSVETILGCRQRFPQEPLCLILGMDAFLKILSWHQWEKLLELSNMIIVPRAGWNAPQSGVLADLLTHHTLAPHEKISDYRAGKIVQQSVTPLGISASFIRSLTAAGQSTRFLLPDPVRRYIRKYSLYSQDSITDPIHQEVVH